MTVLKFPASKGEQEMLKIMGLEYKFDHSTGNHLIRGKNWSVSGHDFKKLVGDILPEHEKGVKSDIKGQLVHMTKNEMLEQI